MQLRSRWEKNPDRTLDHVKQKHLSRAPALVSLHLTLAVSTGVLSIQASNLRVPY
jgi:hypothetical protein